MHKVRTMKSVCLVATLAACITQGYGVELDPTTGPTDAASQMRTLGEIYTKLDTGATSAKQTTFTEPSAGPAVTGKTLDEIYAKTPTIDDTNGADPSEVVSGKVYWGLRNGAWGLQTGTSVLPTLQPSFLGSDGQLIIVIPDGLYTDNKAVTAVDADLVAGNIASGTDVFGVTGTALVATGDAAAANVLTGKSFSNTGAVGVAGSMVNVGAQAITPNASAQVITAGYHNGSGSVAGDADLVAENIADGTDVFGVTGTAVIATGLVNVGAQSITPSASSQAIAKGSHNGLGSVAGDADLVAGNIASGTDVFGVTGTALVATGDAAAAHVLTGKSFSNIGAVGVSGSMANIGTQSITPSTVSQGITAGYHNGSGSVAGDADLVAGNIASGTDVFGVTGTALVATGDAAAANVLTGKSFSNAGAVGVSGSMVNVGAQAITPSASSQTITEGYHNGSGSVAGDADLVAGNIASGTDVFGVTGTALVATGDAAAANVLTGTSFSNAGAVGVAGSMVNVGAQAITPSASSQVITEGYHNGSGSVAGDADLVAGNIASGTDVFGVTGTALVATGDAAAAHVLTGKSFSNVSAVGVAGSMVNVGAQAITPSASSQVITEGYHNGSGSVAGDADLVAGNIANGTDVFGVTGTALVATGDAAAANVLTGKSFSNVGAVGISGSMVNVGAQAITPSSSSQTITEGYHNGSGSVAGDADLVAGNIASGTDVFGVTGTALVATGDATAANVLTGKSFSNVGAVSVSGSMVNVGAQAITPSSSSQTITEGYHNGSGSVAGDADLVAGNIANGTDVFGVTGTALVATGDAAAANVLTGKSFSNVGAVGVSGSMVNVGAQAITPSASSQAITAGYHNGSGSVAGDADLVAGNIANGIDVFGVTGTALVATGDAAAANVLTGKSFSNASAVGVSGSMVNVGAQAITPSTSSQTITEGYHNGSGSVAGDADLVAGNIASGTDVFGVTGTALVATGDAAAANVLTGKSFSNASAVGVSGSIVNVGVQAITPSTSSQTITAGYHNGSGSVAGDADLVAGNIASGTDIFAVTGTALVATGDAAAANVLTGKSFSHAGAVGVSGSMVNVGAQAITPSTSSQTITTGYHNGSGSVAGDVDLVAGNIASGTDVFGVTGTALVATGDAVAANVLTGKSFSNVGAVGVSGSMVNVGAQSITPSTSSQTITTGYHNGSGSVAGDADLVAGNIANGTDVFGVTGTALVATGDAAAANVLTGKSFSNVGAVGVSGSMVNVGAQSITPSTSSQTITAGYHNGSGSVAGDADLVAGNIASGTDVFGVTGTALVATGDAAAANVLTGKSFSHAGAVGVSGSMVNVGAQAITPSASSQAITAGYHNGSGSVAGDADLVAANIKKDTVLFGVTGTYQGSVDILATGQTVANSTAGRDDGALEVGTPHASPRFSDNGDGTVTDNSTGLIWLADTNTGSKTWENALTYCNALANGTAGLTDGSSAGDWRLPNANELRSICHYEYNNPAISNDAGSGQWTSGAGSTFTGVQTGGKYWSSTTTASLSSSAWYMNTNYADVNHTAKTNSNYVWPVRGGQ